MFGHRRQLAREALDRLESRELGARLGEEGALVELARLQARDVELGRRMRAMQQRLDDANAELRRWGLEPVLRDEAESDDHPTRYRRSTDWRLTDFAHVSAAIEAIAPDGVDVTVREGIEVPLGEVGYLTAEEFGAPAEPGTFLRDAVDRVVADASDRIVEAARRAPAIRYESDAPAVVGQDGACQRCGDARHDRREADLAVLAAELGWPGEDAVSFNGLCLRLRDVRAERDTAAALHAACQEEYRSVDASRREALAELAEAAEALAAERTEREQAERSRDRAQGRSLDLERWLEAHVAALGAFVDALTDAHERGTLHIDLVAPFERAVALLANPDA